MNEIKHLGLSDNLLSWEFGGQKVSVLFSGTVAHALVLRSVSVAAIEDRRGVTLAGIWNADGTLRTRLENPFKEEEKMSFYYFAYEHESLVVIFAGVTRDFTCLVNEETGELSNLHETR